MSTSEKTIDMVHGPLFRNICIFAIPLMGTSLLQILFNAVDTIVVGKFSGELALAAVGATGSLCFLLTSIFNGLSVGSNVVIATLLGKNDEQSVRKAVHTSITMALCGGVLLATVGLLLAKQMLQMMSTPEDILHLSALYLRIYFLGSVFMLVYNFGSSILRSKGDTKRPLYFLAISGLLNVVMNLFFIIVLKMGVAGVAIATVISQAVASVLVCYTLIHEKDILRLEINQLGMDWHIAWNIIKIGVPAGISGMVFSLSNVVIQSSINSFDSSTIIAGNSAGANLEGFVYIGMTAFSQAAITFTSQNVGAKNYNRLNRIIWITLLLSVIGGFSIGFVVWCFGDIFLRFYTNEAAVVDVGMIRLTFVALLLVFNGILDIFVAGLRGMGYSTLPTALMVIGICGIRLLWIWNVFPLYRTLDMIYVCFPISWIVTGIILGITWFVCHRKLLRSVEG